MLQNVQDGYTMEWFIWSMEVISSRSFYGINSSGSTLKWGSIVFQFVGFLVSVGGYYILDDLNVVIAGGVISLSGLGLNIFKGERSDIVLLPYIDSINHDGESKNYVVFNPVKRVYKFYCEEGKPGEEIFVR